MKKINFTKVKVFSDYKRESYIICNVKETIINYLYSYIPTSSLNRSFMQRIAETEDEIEITDNEENLLLGILNKDNVVSETFRESLLILLHEDKLKEKLGDKTKMEEISAAMRELLVEINNQ